MSFINDRAADDTVRAAARDKEFLVSVLHYSKANTGSTEIANPKRLQPERPRPNRREREKREKEAVHCQVSCSLRVCTAAECV